MTANLEEALCAKLGDLEETPAVERQKIELRGRLMGDCGTRPGYFCHDDFKYWPVYYFVSARSEMAWRGVRTQLISGESCRPGCRSVTKRLRSIAIGLPCSLPSVQKLKVMANALIYLALLLPRVSMNR